MTEDEVVPPGLDASTMDALVRRGSVSGRYGLSGYDQRQLMYLDAVRLGAGKAAEELARPEGRPAPWRVGWATASDLDPRLRRKPHVGSVRYGPWPGE
jgi:hypothetical protein